MGTSNAIGAAALVGLAALLVGCGGTSPPVSANLEGVPENLREAVAGRGAPSAAVRLDREAGGQSGAAAVAPLNNDLVWTDPDNPDAALPELDGVLDRPQEEVWERNLGQARRRAIRDGKCQLIWFTDSRTSPACKALSTELFGNHEFGRWAEEHLVRVMIDTREPERAPDDDAKARAADYVEKVRKHYKVLGSPTVVMLSPQGELIKSYRGFRPGSGDFFWGQLKQAQRLGERSYEGWRAEMERSGYRDWEGKQGRRMFAKLVSYQDGVLQLVEPDGNRCTTRESNLGAGDRLWLGEQKRLRGLR